MKWCNGKDMPVRVTRRAGGAEACLTSVLHAGEWSVSRPGRFRGRKPKPLALCVGPRAGVENLNKGKLSPLPEFEPCTARPIK